RASFQWILTYFRRNRPPRISGRLLSSRNRKGPWPPRLATGLELRDLVLMAQGEPDVIEPFEEPPPSVIVDLERGREVADRGGSRHEVDRHLDAGVRVDLGPDALEHVLRDDARDEALLARVAPEDVGEARREHDLEAVVAQRPHGVLATRTGAEVGSGDEDRRVPERLLVQHEVVLLPPAVEERVVEAGLRDALQEDGGDDLVGVDVGALE